MKKLSILALALSVLAASCTKEVDEMGSGRARAGEIRVSAMVNGITKATTDGAVTTFENGDQLSLYVWTGDNKAVPDVRWIDGEVNTFNAETGKWEPKDMMLWKNTADAHYFLGVYPARTITNFTADPFSVNLDPVAKNEVNDLLVATILGEGVKASVNPVPLTMDHLMAKLNISIRFRDQWGGIPDNVTVSVKTAVTGTVDYISKTITPGNDVVEQPVFLVGTDLGDPVAHYASHIIPQTGVTEVIIRVNGTKYIYTHPDDIPFAKGHVTTLPLIVGKDAIVLADEGITVEGWKKGETPDLDGDSSAVKDIDLSTLTADCLAINGATLSGTLNVAEYPVKISIAPGATVTLDGVTIEGVNDEKYKWAGITCLGDATIILKDGSTNLVRGFHEDAPGIYIAEGKTLIIKGDGSLTASPVYYQSSYTPDYYYGNGAAIGGGKNAPCGNIEIQGGNITAIGGYSAAGIGGGNGNSNCGTITISGGTVVATGDGLAAGIGCGLASDCGTITISGGSVEATGGSGSAPAIGSAVGESNCSGIIISGGVVTATGGNISPGIGSAHSPSVCGNITISGGTVTATGYDYSPGIGASGHGSDGGTCGAITITDGVTLVTATKGEYAPNSIGAGANATCGTVTIGDMVTGSIPTSPYMYPIDLSKVTANVVAGNGARMFETLAGNYKISIDDGATVILDNASISYSGKGADWAGLTLIGDGTIQLADGTTNTAIGGLASDGYSNWPGIFVPEGKTLTINGNTGVLNAARGTLGQDDGSPAGIGASWGANAGDIVINGGVINATGGNKGAGIGGCGRRGCGDITINAGTVTAIGGMYASGIGLGGTNNSSYVDSGTCGDITIAGGTVNATGGDSGAGIGTGSAIDNNSVAVTKICGNILISGGTVSATGGKNAAGIGSGEAKSNGNITVGTITITDGVTLLTATKGSGAPNSIGKGSGTNVTCGTVTIGGVVGAITDSPYVYPLPYPIDLSEVTSAYVGSVITDEYQHIYKTVADAAAAGEVAVAIIAYVGAPGSVEESDANFKGLAIALSDADGGECEWADGDDWFGYCVSGGVDVDLNAALNLINGKACTNTLEDHTAHSHVAAVKAKKNNDTPHPGDATTWFLPSLGQWNLIVQGLAKKTDNLTESGNDNYKASNLNSVITAAGGTGFVLNGDYWSSSENNENNAWYIVLSGGYATTSNKGNGCYVRSAFAF